MYNIEGQRAKNIRRIFFGILLGGVISSLLYGIATSGGNHYGLLFSDVNDSFMDFYNPVYHAAQADPYIDVDRIYPALAYVFYFLLSLFIPREALALGGKAVRRNQNAQILFILYVIVVAIALGVLLYRLIQGRRREKITLLALLFLSAPFIFVYERGNIIVVSLIFSTLFLMLKDAPDRRHRELALFCLAVSAALKIYPAVLGLLLLKDKRYREAGRCALYGAILFVAPFLLMGGLDKIPVMLGNLMAGSANTLSLENGFGYKVNISNLVSILAGLFGVFDTSVIQVGSYIAYGLLLISLVVAFFLKSKWRTIALLSLLMAGIPGFSFIYSLIFMAVPCILFLNGQEGYRKMDYIYATLFAALFGLFVYGEYDCFLDLGGKLIVNVCTFVESCALFLMLLLINGEGILEIARGYSKRKMAGAKQGAESLRQEERLKPDGRGASRKAGGGFFARVAQIARHIGPERCFYGIMLAALGLLLARSLTAAVSPLCNILSTDEGGRHMGFCQLIYQAGHLRPYQMGGTYPAAVYLAFGLLKTIVPFAYVHVGGTLLRSNQTAIMLWYLFFLLSVLLLILLIHRVKQGGPLGRWVFTGCVLLSAPFLYLYDRGDITLVPLILILLFFWMKDHKTAWVRECGLICLALACGISVMHFLFGLYFAAKKEYRTLRRWLLYAAVVFFVPFFVFGGLEGIGAWYLNGKAADSASRAAGFGYKASISNTVSMLFALAEQQSPQMVIFGNTLGLAALGLGAVAVFGLKEDWKRVALITAAIVLVPQESPVSCLALMVPSLVLFFNAREKGKQQWLYLLCYCGLFVPIITGAYPWFSKLPGILAVRLGTLVESVSLVLMLASLIAEGMKGLTTIQGSEEGTNV